MADEIELRSGTYNDMPVPPQECVTKVKDATSRKMFHVGYRGTEVRQWLQSIHQFLRDRGEDQETFREYEEIRSNIDPIITGEIHHEIIPCLAFSKQDKQFTPLQHHALIDLIGRGKRLVKRVQQQNNVQTKRKDTAKGGAPGKIKFEQDKIFYKGEPQKIAMNRKRAGLCRMFYGKDAQVHGPVPWDEVYENVFEKQASNLAVQWRRVRSLVIKLNEAVEKTDIGVPILECKGGKESLVQRLR